ncbi:hypothetical protein UCRPC4_g04072 [Phaeomoniella chlamydospora]|uniref:alpha-amylase n=1 Tax=Phaeomoniella chlamydospora TaxID=158046 RepID=A0A0G2GVQ4_PHACM|nr:hypothetical protein UCRPC4_g04072 [Phaeomoniella chlamydospora]
MGFTAIWISPITMQIGDSNTYHGYDQSNLYKVNSHFGTASDLQTLSIDGFRIDSVQNVEPDFFPDFSSAAGVYCVGEVLNSQSSYVCPYQDYLDGIINYPLYFSLISAFESTSGSMTDLASVYTTLKSSCADTTLMAPFLENHDRPRFPYYTSDTSLIRNAILTTLMSDGPPIIYEGQEYGLSSSGDPYNREAIWLQSGAYSTTGTYHGFIALVNLIRNQLIMATSSDSSWSVYKSEIIYSDSHTIALRKGSAGTQSVTLITNQGSDGSAYDVTLTTSETGWDVDEDIVEAISCDTGTTNSGGGFVVSVESEPQIWLGSSLLSGTGLCGL